MEIDEIDEIECLKEAGYSKEDIDEFINARNKDTPILNENTGCVCIQPCLNKLGKPLPILDKIQLIPDQEVIYVRYNNKDLSIATPRIYVPFGIDSYYKNWSIHFELKNDNCEGVKELKTFLINLEELIIKKLEIDNKQLNTQLKTHTKFNMEFYGRIRNQYGKYKCVIEDMRKQSIDKYVNIYKFPKGVYVKANLSINGIWMVDNKYCYKYSIDKLIIVD